MSKKPKNTSNDDFDFMNGGSEEFFPLENPGNKGGTPPKGVKGYLKNVAKSVLNLGVKVNKSLYPEAFSLAENIKELGMDDTGNVYDVKGIINKYAQKTKNIVAEGKKIGKEIIDDAKTSIKTGYYVKTEDEDAGFDDMMANMFGDFGDMGDSDWGDDFGDDWGDSDDSDESSTPKRKGRISSSEATVKSTMASTKALLKSGQKQQAAIIGAAQSHIRHETEIFAQQLQLSQYQHRQKMNVMKNIANNLVKVIDQNNIKLKAQMEYSAKSLAFTQDINAMLKEIREAQFTLVKPKEKTELQESARNKIFGSNGTSLNMNQWIKQIKNQFAYTGAGSGLSTLGDVKGLLGSMTDMGMSSTQAVKMMVGPMILDSITNSLLTGKSKENIDLANMKMQGIGTALNTQLGKIARGNNKTLNSIRDWANKQDRGFMGFLGSLVNKGLGGIEGFANMAHVSDNIRYQSDRYRLGNPEEVHPFDNKAHKALTEIIPSYLSQISAGVNHTEETMFDWDSNQFISKRTIQEKVKNVENETLSYVNGIDNMRDSFMSLSTSKTSKLNSLQNLDQIYNVMMKNYLSAGLDFSDETLKQTLGEWTKGGEYHPSVLGEQILAGTHLVDDDQKYEALKNFRKHINQAKPHNSAETNAKKAGLKAGKEGSSEYLDAYKKYVKDHIDKYGDTNGTTDIDAKKDWIRFQTSASTFRSNASDDYLRLEEYYSKSNSIDYQNALTSVKDGNKNEIDRCEEQIKNIKKQIERIDENKTKTSTDQKKKLKLIDQMDQLYRRIRQLKQTANQRVSDTNLSALQKSESAYFNSNETNEFEKFRLSSLEDSTTHGLVQNIYNLLLSGIDVYTTPKSTDPNDPHNKLVANTKNTLATNNKQNMETKNASIDNERYTSVGVFPEDTDKETWLTDKFGKNYANYTGHIFWKENGKWKSEYLDKFKPVPGVSYYKSNLEQNGIHAREMQAMRSRAYEDNSDPFYEDKDRNYNVFQKAFGKVRKGFSGLQDFKTGILNGFMGKLYDEEYDEDMPSIKSKASDLLTARVSKELSTRLNTLEVNGTTLPAVIESINDPAFKNALNTVKGDVGKQVDFLIEQSSSHKDLQPYVQELTDVKKQLAASSSTKGAMSVIVNNMRRRLKTGVDKRLEPVARKLLTGRLLSIKVGDKRLASTLANIDDQAFHEVLKKEKDPIKKAEFILSKIQTYPSLASFDEPLREFIKKSEETLKSPMGASSAIINDKIDKIKARLKQTGNKFLNKFFAKKDIKKLLNIKVDNVTLRETIQNDSGLVTQVQKAFETAEQVIAANPNNNSVAPYGTELLKIKNEKLDPYRPAIQQWIDSVSDKIGSIGTKGGNFVDKMIDKALDLVDKFITGKDRKTGKKNEMIGPELSKIKGLKEALQKACEGTGYDLLLPRLNNDLARAVFIKTKMADYEEIKPFLLELTEYIDEKKKAGLSKINNVKDKVKGKGQEFLKYAKDKGIDLKNLSKAEKDKLVEEWKTSQVDDEGNFEIEEGDSFTKRMMKRGKSYGKKTSKFASKQLKKGKGLFNKGKKGVQELTAKGQEAFKNGDFNVANIGGLIGSSMSAVSESISNLTEMANKHFNKNDAGAVEGDKAEEQRKMKEERKKKREEDKFKREQRSFWKKVGSIFGKKGVHLDEAQQEDLMKQHGALLAGLGGGGGGFLGNVTDLIKGPASKRLDAAKNLLKNPKILTAAGAGVAAFAGWQHGKNQGKKHGTVWSNYKKFKDQDKREEEGDLGYDDDGKQLSDIQGATEAVGAGYVGLKATKGVGHFVNKTKSKFYRGLANKSAAKNALKTNQMLDKAAALEKAGNISGANKALDKAMKLEQQGLKQQAKFNKNIAKFDKRANKFSKNGGITKQNVAKTAGHAMAGLTGAFFGATIANSIATKAGLSEKATTAVTVGGAVAGGGAGVGISAGITKAAANPNSLLGKIFRKVAEKLGGAAKDLFMKVMTPLINAISKVAPKLGAKLAEISAKAANAAMLIAMITAAVAAFGDGMSISTTRSKFSLDKNANVTLGMRLTSGLIACLNTILCGALDLIFGLITVLPGSVFKGFTNITEAIYLTWGPKSEQAALMKYQEYSTNRAKILGVKREQLVSWEARYQDGSGWGKTKNAAKSAVRSVGHFLAKGVAAVGNAFGAKVKADDIVASDDKHSADLLGFATKDIYKYWKENKYEPCDKISVDIANKHGGVKKVFELTMPTEAQKNSKKDKDIASVKAYEERSQAQVEILQAMKKYVIDNDLAWLTNDITVEDFEKHMEQRKKDAIGAFKALKEGGAKGLKEYQEKLTAERQKNGESLLGFESSSDSESSKSSSDSDADVLSTNNSANKEKTKQQYGHMFKAIGNWVKSKFKEYKFNDREQEIMNSATAAIQEVHTNVDPTFYGNNPASNIKPGKGKQSDTDVIFAGGNGGADSSSEGYFVKVKTEKSKQPNAPKYVPGQSKQETNKKQPNKKRESDTYDMSGNTPKSTVMNSIVSDFAKNFGNELNARLNILEEMHKENMRHNKVAEEFFTAALAMMSQIAKHSGNTNMGSRLDSMISQITM